MKLQARYENGYLRLPNNVHLVHDPVELEIEVPDDEVVVEESTMERGEHRKSRASYDGGVKQKLNAILGPYREKSAKEGENEGEYKKLWHQHLEARYIAEE